MGAYKMRQWTIIRWLLSFVKPLKGRMILAIFLGIISNLAVVAISIIGLQGVLAILSQQPVNPQNCLVMMVGCGVIRGVARYCEQYLNHDIAFRLLAIIRQQIFATLRQLGPARLAGKKSGDLVAAITTDVEALEVFFAHTVSPVFIALGTTLVTVSYLASYHLGLGLLLLLGQLIVGVALPVLSYRRYQTSGPAYQKAFIGLNQQVMENIASLQDIFQFGLKEQRLAKLKTSGQALNQQYQQRLAQGSGLQIMSEGLLIGTAGGVFLTGTLLQLPVATVLVGTVLSLSSFGSVLALNGLGSALVTTLASGRRLYDLNQEQPTVSFADSQRVVAELTDVELADVSFGYEEGQGILKDLSLSLKRGQWLGIGGESGSGKSTLVKLLMRYWDPQGRIAINQEPLPTIQEASLHQLESVMEQSTFLFEETIGANIRLGRKGASQEMVEVAAQKAAIHQWIMTLPEGYETKIGGQARSISDGERQRIGLARLFLHDGPLLLLDEPTSNLDYVNEQAILKTLTAEANGKTVLVISHRETTLALAQERVYLKKGGVTR